MVNVIITRNPKTIWEKAASPKLHFPYMLQCAILFPPKFAPYCEGHTPLTTLNGSSATSHVFSYLGYATTSPFATMGRPYEIPKLPLPTDRSRPPSEKNLPLAHRTHHPKWHLLSQPPNHNTLDRQSPSLSLYQ